MRYVVAVLLFAASCLAVSQNPARTLEADAPIMAVGFSGSGSEVIGVGADRSARVWNVRSGELVRTIPLDGTDNLGAAISPAGELVVAGSADTSVSVFSLDDGRVVHRLQGHERMPYGYVYGFSADSRFLATGSQDEVRVWELRTGELEQNLDDGPGASVAFAFSADSRLLAGANEDTNVRIWDLDTGELVGVIDQMPLLTPSLRFTPDGTHLVGINLDGRVYLWDTESWRLVRQFEEAQPESGWSMDLSPDGRLLATGGMDAATTMNPSSLVLWELESGTPVRTIRFPHSVISIDFSPDGTMLAVASIEAGVSLWDVSRLLAE